MVPLAPSSAVPGIVLLYVTTFVPILSQIRLQKLFRQRRRTKQQTNVMDHEHDCRDQKISHIHSIGLDWLCYLAGNSKMAPTIFFSNFQDNFLKLFH